MRTAPFYPSLSQWTRLEVGKNHPLSQDRAIFYGGNLGVSQSNSTFGSGGEWSQMGLWGRNLGASAPVGTATFTPGTDYLASLHKRDKYGASIGIRALSTTQDWVFIGENNYDLTRTHSAQKEMVLSMIQEQGQAPTRMVFEHVATPNTGSSSADILTTLMVLQANGSLGLGTSTPQASFHLKQASGATIPYLNVQDNLAATKFIIDNGGNVGVGVASPSEKLDVGGNIKATGNGTLDNDLTVGQNVNFLNLPSFTINVADKLLYIKPTGEVYQSTYGTQNMWSLAGNNLGAAPSAIFGTWSNTDINLLVGGQTVGNIKFTDKNLEYKYATTFGRLNVPVTTDYSTRIHSTKALPDGGYLNHRIFSVFDGDYSGGAPNGNEIFSVLPVATNIGTGYTSISNFATFLNLGSSGLMTINGDIMPAMNNTTDIGSSTTSWRQVYAQNTGLFTSDLKKKTNIENSSYGLSTILQMRPVTFEWKENANGTRIGFIAQEIQKLIPEVVVVDSLDNYAMRYTELIPVLTKGMQEQQKMIDSLTQKLNLLIYNKNEKLALGEQSAFQQEKLNKQAILFQNNPNPFQGITRIDYYVPLISQSAFIKITDTNGKLVKAFTLKELGYGQVELDCSDLAAGQYYYSLLVNQTMVDTKKMQVGVSVGK